MVDAVSERENLAADYASRAYEASLHTGDPGDVGYDEISERVVIAWTSGAEDGVYSANVDFDVPGSTDTAWIALWRQDGSFMDKSPAAATFVSPGVLHALLTYTQE